MDSEKIGSLAYLGQLVIQRPHKILNRHTHCPAPQAQLDYVKPTLSALYPADKRLWLVQPCR